MNAGLLGVPVPGLLLNLGTKTLAPFGFVDWQLPPNWLRLTLTVRGASSTLGFTVMARFGFGVGPQLIATGYDSVMTSLVNGSTVGGVVDATGMQIGTGNAVEICHATATFVRTGPGRVSYSAVAVRGGVVVGNMSAGSAPIMAANPTRFMILPTNGVFDAGEANLLADVSVPGY